MSKVTVDLDDLLHVLREAEGLGVKSNQLVRLTNATLLVRLRSQARREETEDPATIIALRRHHARAADVPEDDES